MQYWNSMGATTDIQSCPIKLPPLFHACAVWVVPVWRICRLMQEWCHLNQPELPSDKGSNLIRGATLDICRGPTPLTCVSRKYLTSCHWLWYNFLAHVYTLFNLFFLLFFTWISLNPLPLLTMLRGYIGITHSSVSPYFLYVHLFLNRWTNT